MTRDQEQVVELVMQLWPGQRFLLDDKPRLGDAPAVRVELLDFMDSQTVAAAPTYSELIALLESRSGG